MSGQQYKTKKPVSRYRLYQLAFELDIEYTHTINKYPPREKWVLCAETRTVLEKMMRHCLDVKDTEDKLEPALAMKVEIRYLDHLTKKAFELGYIGDKKQRALVKTKAEVKQLLEGVIRRAMPN